MIAKKILFGKNARDQIKVGIDTAADVAKVTIGPRGRNVMVDRGIMPPEITNDGLNAIRTIVLQDRVHNMGVDLVKDVAVKTNDKAKGARTASIILMQSIFNEGMDYMEQGYNAIAIKRAIEKGAASVIEKLKSRAILVSKESEIEAVATISSESADIGKVVAEVVNKVGVDGVVTVEESPVTTGIVSDYTEGMKIDKGWIHPGFVNNFNKMEAEYENIPVILINRKMIQIGDFLPLQEQLANNGMGEVLIMVEDMEGEALETLVANNLRGGFKTVVIKTPGFGIEKAEILKDISIATGATVISEESGNPLKLAKLDSVGFAKKVVVGRNSTIIVSAPDQKTAIQERIVQLKGQLETLESKTDRANMESRISKMSEGVGVIKVGAATESGIKYLKMKIDDAVNEARNAMQEGFISGGGTELVKIAYELEYPENATDEDKVGYDIIKKAIKAPFEQILKNAGNEDGNVIEIITTTKDKPNIGYDAVTNKIVDDMIEYGIIDSVKVIRIALENASEAAATALTTESVVCDETVK